MKELLIWSFIAGVLNGLLLWMREHANEEWMRNYQQGT